MAHHGGDDCELCVLLAKSSERGMFVLIGTDVAVKLLRLNFNMYSFKCISCYHYHSQSLFSSSDWFALNSCSFND